MKRITVAAMAALMASGAVLAAGPFDPIRGKMKEGMYEYKIDMDMAGMPGGMGKHSTTVQHCVTAKDIEGGDFAKGNNNPGKCEIKDMKASGSTADYKMVCTDPEMTSDNHIVFRDNGFAMDSKTSMKQQGQVMNMSQHMEGKYLGACK
jgi:uncharacterized protein DUF3617